MFSLKDNQLGFAEATILDKDGHAVPTPPDCTFDFQSDDLAHLTVEFNTALPGAKLHPGVLGLTGLTTSIKGPDGAVLASQHDDVDIVPSGLSVVFSILP